MRYLLLMLILFCSVAGCYPSEQELYNQRLVQNYELRYPERTKSFQPSVNELAQQSYESYWNEHNCHKMSVQQWYDLSYKKRKNLGEDCNNYSRIEWIQLKVSGVLSVLFEGTLLIIGLGFILFISYPLWGPILCAFKDEPW